MARVPQPWPIRATHWLNALFLLVMAGSGLRIFIAYPRLGPVGQLRPWYPLQGQAPPQALTIGGWLAGARHWHFAFAWLLLVNAAVYGIYFFASGQWRERLFLPRRDLGNAVRTLLHDVRLGPAPPQVGLYNGAQRLAYTLVAFVLAPLVVVTGIALYKPVQLPRLTALLGGYDTARDLHFLGLAALVMFTLVHVVQVLVHPRTLLDMTVRRRRGAA